MKTIRILIDLQRSQRIAVDAGNVDAEIVCEFTDERGRDRLMVRVNGHEFAIARPMPINNPPANFATQEELVAEYNANGSRRRELARAGGDATLLRR